MLNLYKWGNTMTRVELMSIECTQNNQKFYMTVMNSDILKRMCFITRREENQEEGFQRLLNEARAKEIQKYLDIEKGIIPSPIILSAQSCIDLKYTEGKISFVENEKGYLVIDGQHRLYGLIKSLKNYEVPVVIFEGLKKVKEVNLFIDINTTQKGVSPALLIDLKKMANKENDIESKQRELFDYLNSVPPLAGLLSPSKSVVGKISRKAFNEATLKIFDSTYFANTSIETIEKAVVNYLTAVDNIFVMSKSKEARLNKAVIFKAIFNIFNEVIQKSLLEKNDLKIESLITILEPISTIEYSTVTGTNKATENKLTEEMKLQINKNIKLHEDMF